MYMLGGRAPKPHFFCIVAARVARSIVKMNNQKRNTWFGEVYFKLVNDNKLEEFRSADNASKVNLLYYLSEDVKFDVSQSRLKDFKRAEALKIEANQLFHQHRYIQAVSIYNEAITMCSQDDSKGKKLYAILIANRSAVFYEDGQYEKVLQDIAFLKQYGNHPKPDVIAAREVKALAALRKSVGSKGIKRENDGTLEELQWSSGNKSYPALSHKLVIQKNDTMGRYVVAKDDFKIGEIVAIEEPYASVTSIANKESCECCAVSTNQIYSCPRCQTVYCGMQCLEKAQVYHQHECGAVLVTMLDMGFDRTTQLALRIITQRSVEQVIKDEKSASKKRELKVYNTDDYYNISHLIQHDEPQANLLKYAIDAVFLLKLLKTTKYFGSVTKDNSLSEEEVFIGGLLLKNHLILSYNSYELHKLQIGGALPNPETVFNAVYPTLSLFNHSCDPSVLRYSLKNRMILRSIKPIKAGDIVFDSYGQRYDTIEKPERQNLATKYRFTCTCQACVEDWPLLRNMDPNMLRVGCKCGEAISFHMQNTTVTCPKCKRNKSTVSVLTKYMNVTSKLSTADYFLKSGNFDSCRKLCAEMIDSLYQFLTPPCYAISTFQGGLIHCIQNASYKNI